MYLYSIFTNLLLQYTHILFWYLDHLTDRHTQETNRNGGLQLLPLFLPSVTSSDLL